VTGRGRRRKQLMDDHKERRGHCNLNEEALDRTVWRTGCGPLAYCTPNTVPVINSIDGLGMLYVWGVVRCIQGFGAET
jgi:hypothetical protein